MSDPIKLTTVQQLFGNIDSSQTFSCFADLQAFNSLPPTNQTEETFVVNGLTDFADESRHRFQRSPKSTTPQDTLRKALAAGLLKGPTKTTIGILDCMNPQNQHYINFTKKLDRLDDRDVMSQNIEGPGRTKHSNQYGLDVDKLCEEFNDGYSNDPTSYLQKPAPKNQRPKFH